MISDFCLIRRIFKDYVSFAILIVTKTNKDDVGLGYPDLLPKLATDVTEPFHPIEAHGLEPAVPNIFVT